MLDRYLDDLEKRLDADQELALKKAWIQFANGEAEKGHPFKPPRRKPSQPAINWPDINMNDAIQDEELMLISQFKLCSDQLADGSNKLLSVRANYGVGIVPSFFGSEPFIMPREMNCLPNVRPLAGGQQALQEIITNPLPTLDQGYGPAIFGFASCIREIKQQYPHIARFIRVDHPDGQGPFDVLELLWGSDIFVSLYLEPDLVHALLDKILSFLILFYEKWLQEMPPLDSYHAYFGRLHRGLITIRDDSATNLSPALCRDFIHPYDACLLDHFGGGAIHFCGRGDHFLPDMVRSKGLFAIDLSQPHLNDLTLVISETIDRGIHLLTVADKNLDTLDCSHHACHRLSLQ